MAGRIPIDISALRLYNMTVARRYQYSAACANNTWCVSSSNSSDKNERRSSNGTWHCVRWTPILIKRDIAVSGNSYTLPVGHVVLHLSPEHRYVMRMHAARFDVQRNHRRRKEVWDGGGNTGVWGTGVPQRSPGAEPPVGGLGAKSPRSWKKIKVVTSKFYAFFGSIVFHTFSPIYAYVFSVFAGIVPLSLRNGGWAFDTVCPLSASGGNCPLCPPPPAPPPMS